MISYSYTAHADGGTHNTQYGYVDASTPTEAEAKVKAMYSYTVHVSLRVDQWDGIQMVPRTVMDRGRLC